MSACRSVVPGSVLLLAQDFVTFEEILVNPELGKADFTVEKR